MKTMIDQLESARTLPREDLRQLLSPLCPSDAAYLAARARAVRERVYGKDVFLRGLIEFTNFCKRDCLYCGIRRSNARAERYRLTQAEILECCDAGWALGFRTFVLQGGEDGYFTDARLCAIVRAIKQKYPDCAVTLSVGERPFESYRLLREAGADRYLLRHETACRAHYEALHPREMAFDTRLRCLGDLRALGYATGCGMMVGSPGQTLDCLVDDLEFIRDFQPQMVGIGPFLPHRDTPFAACPAGSPEMTLRLLSIVRLMLPGVLLPATTALDSAQADGRARGMLAGANVAMPNLSPARVREKYALYDGKKHSGDEAAEGLSVISGQMAAIGYRTVIARGDPKEG
ncbi:MAG: [FeFe] hydrogenase H-cluster radical SAM maturase HydE [Clostridia bacterium]